MKKTCYLLVLLFCLGFSISFYAQEEQSETHKPIVIIDPGHGGVDAGAIGVNGVKEKDIVLSIALKMLKLNRSFYKNKMKLYLTRYADTLIDLKDRTYLSKKLNADVFISIHCNQASNPNAKGMVVFVYPKSEADFDSSVFLGFTIQKGLANGLGIKNRGVQFGDFHVLRNGRKGTPTILLELGFLSQIDEETYLSKEEPQNVIAMVILQSITKFSGY